MQGNHTWVRQDGGVFVKPLGPFDHVVAPLPQVTTDLFAKRAELPPTIQLRIFCDRCRQIVDFSGYCKECEDFSVEVLDQMLRDGRPYPDRPDEYCQCGWLRNYCLCHVNLALFSNKKHKPEQ